MNESIQTALYDLVHDFPGGAPALAGKFNTLKQTYPNHFMYSPPVMNSGTLQHKANRKMESHHLTLSEAVSLMYVTKDFRLLHAMASSLGFACVAQDAEEGVSDIEFLNQFTAAMKEVGDMAKSLNDAFADQRISAEEVRAFSRETLEAITAISQLPAKLQGMSDE